MNVRAAIAGGVAVALAGAAVLTVTRFARVPQVAFTAEERETILAHGPWPPPLARDPSNRVSGEPRAIVLGRALFFDPRLSADGTRACATCHDPAKAYSDGRPRSLGAVPLDGNAIALANLALNRWFGWAGAADSLWAQSIRPILDAKELNLTPEELRRRLGGDPALAQEYERVWGSRPGADAPERVLVNVAKALAAFQETIVTGRTPFDDFRDALARGDVAAMARYPLAAQRGLRTFAGRGRCSLCHAGPNFTSGEFEDIGVAYFAEPGRVDSGRHGGIASLQTSPFTRLGAYSDDPAGEGRLPAAHVEQLHRNWGEFRVPSLRNVAATAPYMHSGGLASLEAVVRHYSEVDVERLHGEESRSLIRPLRLTPQDSADLVAFLETLSGPVSAAR